MTETGKTLQDFEFYLAAEARLAPASVRRAMVAIKRLIKEDALRDRETFLRHCAERIKCGLDPYTINKDIATLKHYLAFQKIEWEPIRYFKTTIKNKLSPTTEEISSFIAIHTTATFDMYWKVQTICGTRPSEVLKLRVQDLDFQNQCFWPQKTKTDDGKPIIVPPRVMEQLREYVGTLPASAQYLFPSSYYSFKNVDKPMTVEAAEKDCRKRLKIMGCKKPYTPNSFRHAYITIGIANGVPVQYIQRSVRHSRIQTTINYFDKSVDYAKKAARAHPFYRESMTTKQIIESWIEYIKQTADNRFDNAKLQKAFAVFYESTVT